MKIILDVIDDSIGQLFKGGWKFTEKLSDKEKEIIYGYALRTALHMVNKATTGIAPDVVKESLKVLIIESDNRARKIIKEEAEENMKRNSGIIES